MAWNGMIAKHDFKVAAPDIAFDRFSPGDGMLIRVSLTFFEKDGIVVAL